VPVVPRMSKACGRAPSPPVICSLEEMVRSVLVLAAECLGQTGCRRKLASLDVNRDRWQAVQRERHRHPRYHTFFHLVRHSHAR